MSDHTPSPDTTGQDAFTGILQAHAEALHQLGSDPSAEQVKRLQDDLIVRNPSYGDRLRAWFDAEHRLEQELPHVPGFELLHELGRGGMGVVYKARDLALARIVALKMILAGAHASVEDQARFLHEARAAAHLQHPNIVQVFEVGECRGLPYYSMEFIDGDTLADRLHGTPLPPRDAAQLTVTLALAIEAAHQAGIIHRDLKPANVLLREKSDIRYPKSETKVERTVSDSGYRISDFQPKITDFGLAKNLDDDSGQTRTGAIMGTASYMSFEQAAGLTTSIGPQTDVYALGATLYEMLTGRPPFRAATRTETLNQVLQQEPVSPRVLQPYLPRDLETICLKCLSKNPAGRYTAAKELAEDLQAFLDGKPIKARPVGMVVRAGKWLRRHTWGVAVGLAIAVALAFGVVSFVQRQNASAHTRQVYIRQIHDARAEAIRHQVKGQAADDPQEYALALDAVKRAAALLDQAEVEDELRQQITSLTAELEIAHRQAEAATKSRSRDRALIQGFKQARLRKTYPSDKEFDYEGARDLYIAAFEADGVNVKVPSIKKIAAAFIDRSAAVRAETAAALTDLGIVHVIVTLRNGSVRKELFGAVWGIPPTWERLFAAADSIDENPWRRNLRKTITQPFAITFTPNLVQLSKTVKLEDHPLANLTLLAEALGGFENYNAAVALLRRMHPLYKDDFWVNHLLSIYSGHTNPPRWDEAARFSTAALACLPSSPLPHYNLGVALVMLGRPGEAEEEFAWATKIDPHFVLAWINLGAALATNGKPQKAIAAWQTAFDLGRGNYAVIASAGNNLFNQGDYEGAEAIYRYCTQVVPEDEKAHHNLGVACLRLERYEEGIEHLHQALKLKPDMFQARVTLATALQRLGRYEEALTEFRTVREKARRTNEKLSKTLERVDIPLCEQERTLAEKLPALRMGTAVLATAAERHTAALVAFRHGYFDVAARLFLDETRTPSDRQWFEEYSYMAACAAARASDGEKQGATAVRRRSQALDCLRQALLIWEKLCGSKNPAERALGVRKVRHSLIDIHLAEVREKDRLERLAPEERKEWEKLWAGIRKLVPREAGSSAD